jgi:caffeoyl-CoA O-methyltransferase
MQIINFSIRSILLLIVTAFLSSAVKAQDLKNNPALDEKVKKFLAGHSHQWHDMNVPESDGQLLYDIIIKNNYRSALEIGTSTGHSGIWIAWALSKTGGKLITIDIDEKRHNIALGNFKEAGLSEYIDARLADAHSLVKELSGPFDFVFSDADKGWYKNYFIDIDPLLKTGGCYTSHNVYGENAGDNSWQGEYLRYLKSLKNYETTVNNEGAGLAISYKRAEK